MRAAAELTGKSVSSIRRIIYPILKADAHPDRHHIQPSVEEAMQRRIKGENPPWLISEDLLRRVVPLETEVEKGTAASSLRGAAPEGGELLQMLRRELDIKNQQITQQHELLSALSERLREGNVLIRGLQQQLALTDGKDKPVSDVAVTPTSATTSVAEKRSMSTQESPKRKGVFSRLFGN